LNHESLWLFFFLPQLDCRQRRVHWLPAKFSWVIGDGISGVGFFALVVPEKTSP